MGLSQPKDYQGKNGNPPEVILTAFNCRFNKKWIQISFLSTLSGTYIAKTLYSSHQDRTNKVTFLIDLVSW